MNYENITTEQQLRDYCRALAGAPSIGFDTEFVAEHTYWPVLCLVQVAAEGRLAVIDPLAVGEMRPFWEAVAAEGHETIVHAGRGEVEFCVHAVGRPPAGLFDVQIAAGFVGIEYPAGYGTLLAKVLGESPKKHETRTDWRIRPLTTRQIEYALDDVRFLHPLRDALHERLTALGRREWLAEDLADWLAQIEQAHGQQRWRRVSGNAGLSGRGLAIVRELWHWREAEAERRNLPPRRVLRDDLIIELARRQTSDPKRIGALRGMERGDLKRRLPELAEAIERGVATPEERCPAISQRDRLPQLAMLGQFLYAALGSLCHQANITPSLVGTPNDVRDLIVYRTLDLGKADVEPPALARGWRAEVVGHLFEDLLAGQMSIRIADPQSEHPLVIERGAGG